VQFTFAPSLPLSLALSPPLLVFLRALSASVVKKKFKGSRFKGSRVQGFKGYGFLLFEGFVRFEVIVFFVTILSVSS